MSELKPCPFCGGKPISYEYMGGHIIICRSCGINLTCSRGENFVKKWNTRHYPADVQQAVERMKPVVIKPEKTDEYHQSGDEFYLVRCPDCGKEFKLLGFKYSTDVRHCGCCGKAFTLNWSEE